MGALLGEGFATIMPTLDAAVLRKVLPSSERDIGDNHSVKQRNDFRKCRQASIL